MSLFTTRSPWTGARTSTRSTSRSNDRLWLRDQFARLRSLESEADRIRGIEAILHRTDPGPGGFYDDLGNLRRQPHLVHATDYAADPDFRHSSLVGFGSRAGWPLAWCQNAQTLHDAPLQMRYDGLDGKARYKVRVVYAGDSFRNLIRLDADEHQVHDWFKKPDPPVPVEFDVPAAGHRRRQAHPDLAPGARQGSQRPRLPGGRGLVDPEMTADRHSEDRSMAVHEKPSSSCHPEALSLPARYYTDPANYQSELERFFLGMWIHAGRADQIPATWRLRAPRGRRRERDRHARRGRSNPRVLQRLPPSRHQALRGRPGLLRRR